MPVLTTLGAATAKAWGFLQQVAAAADPYFNYVTMLLTGNGTNGAQNNTFLDSSTNNFTITRNGNTTQGSFSPYGSLWSNYFNGSSDTGEYVPAGSAFAYGTGDFTVECWFYMTSLPSYGTHLLAQTESGVNYFLCRAGTGYVSSERKLEFRWGSSAITGSTIFSLNTWNHAAFVRRSGVVYLYLNGTLDGSGSVTDNFNNTTYNPTIGRSTHSSENLMTGYISNMRVVKGTGVYTSNFTPSTTPLTAISGTSLLTCQSNRFVDNSGNNFTVTPIGSTSVQRFSPFNPTASYDTATIGGSGYFDGSGDYLVVAGGSSNAYNFGTGNATVEAWVKTTQTSTGVIASNFSSGNSSVTDQWRVTMGQNVAGRVEWSQGSTVVAYNSKLVNDGAWHHVAAVINGGSVIIYVDGVAGSSASLSGYNYTATTDMYVGAYYAAGFPIQSPFNGYITNLRINKGTAVYTSNFTPPTSPLTAISGTTALLNFINAGIPDSAMMNDLETVGNAQVSTTQSKFGTGSVYFDGTGDWLNTITPASGSPLTLGVNGEKFTVEFWMYPTSSANGAIIEKGGGSGSWNSTNGIQWVLNKYSTDTLRWQWWTGSTNTMIESSSSVSQNTWTYVAITYDGTTTTLYINGVSKGTSTASYGLPSAATIFRVGAETDGSIPYTGYVDDLRITKGYVRTITTPTTAFPTY